jgi:sirohydrochlorin cobaltochelatase
MTLAIVLFGHGSRDPAWRRPMDEVARRIRAQDPALAVECAFLELQAPDFPAAVDALVTRGVSRIRVLPMFLGVGRHAREDLPHLVRAAEARHPGVVLDVTPSIGELDEVLDLLATLATRQP